MGDSLDYNYEDEVEIPTQSPAIYQMYQMRTGFRYMFMAVYSNTMLLGLLLNSIVIFMVKRDRSQSVKTFILGLAVTHLVFCLFIPFYLISAYQEFTWQFGDYACKLVCYVKTFNLISVSLMITFWKMDRCSSRCSEHHMVLLSWVLGFILSVPPLLSRKVQYTADGMVCLDNPDPKTGMLWMTAGMLCRLIFGLLLPLVVTCFNCCKNTNKSITYVTSVHFLCWAPVLCLSVLQLKMSTNNSLITHLLSPATALSALNSCISPIIFLWQGIQNNNNNCHTGSFEM